MDSTLLLADGAEEDDPTCGMNLLCHASRATGDYAASQFQTALADLAASLLEGVGEVAAFLGTAWFFIDIGHFFRDDPVGGTGFGHAPGAEISGLETLLEWTAFVSFGLCIISLIVLGATLAWRSHQGVGGEHLSKIILVLMASILIAAASGIARNVVAYGPNMTASGPVLEIQRHLWWYVGAAVVLSVILGAARIAWEQRADPAKQLVGSLMTMIVVSSAGVGAIGLLTAASDGFARNLVFGPNGVADGDFGAQILKLLGLSPNSDPVFGIILVLLIGFIALFVCIVQIMLLIIRDGMLVVLASVLPLAASFTNTAMGRQFLTKTAAWIIAFVLYKPAAAILYAVAIEIVKPPEDGEMTLIHILIGMGLMVMSLLAMPALMRLVVPAASLGGGNTAAMGLSGGAAFFSGSIASGAIDRMSQGGNEAAEAPTGNAGGSAPTATGGTTSSPDAVSEGDGAGADDTAAQATGSNTQQSAETTGGGTEVAEGAGGSDAAASTGGSEAAAGGGNPAGMIVQRLAEGKENVEATGREFTSEATGGPDGHQ